MIWTSADEDEALFMDWVYVFGRRVLTIFHHVPTGTEIRRENMQGHWWMEPRYRWARVTQVALQGEEPDWKAIEALGHRQAEESHRVVALAQRCA